MGTAGADIPGLPARPEDAHKGCFGHVLAVGGSRGLSGAPVLAGMAALRTGAGLVTVAGPDGIVQNAVAPFPELMCLPLGDTGTSEVVRFTDERANVLAIGPGLGRAQAASTMVTDILAACRLPAVVDADALFPYSGNAASLASNPGPRVITPHPGEAARLLGVSVGAVQSDRDGTAAGLAAETGAVVVLKGRGTLVVDSDRRYTNMSGGPELAKGGSGDVLTGVIAGLLAQGMPPFEASVLGVYLHGLAGELAAAVLSPYSVIAGDVIDKLAMACRIRSRGWRGGI
ncbi:MAG: NAD(P)H-hydrate dehydratase [Planctomycetes bacterium]|nr:NAD(P)H-hydrate dehydratase [Planctomycetota bacterium]